MSKLSKTEKIVKFLEEHQDKKFTTREIVENLLVLYPEDFSEKRKKYKDEIEKLVKDSSLNLQETLRSFLEDDLTENNIGVISKNNILNVRLAKDLKDLNSITFNNGANGANGKTVVNGEGMTIKDAAGNSGVIHSGDVQWMTAASGVLHKEFHEKEYAKRDVASNSSLR